MNRRTFSTLSLAATFAPLPSQPMAKQSRRDGVGFQFVAIKDGLLTAQHGGMATDGHTVDDSTLFQVASCSKTVTSLTVLTLVRDGRVSLDAPVNEYLRRWQLPGRRGDRVSTAELMSHTAGTSIHGFGGYGPSEELPNLIEILDGREPANSGVVRTTPRLFNHFKYSGGGTTVLQALIEDVTREKFAGYVKKAVLDPVGATAATFAITPSTDFAHGFYENGQRVAGGFRRHPESAAAGLWSSASDLAKILQAVLNSVRRKRHAILPYDLAARMVTPVRQQSGLGIFVDPGRLIWHEGRNYGFDAIMAADLASGRVRAAVANRNGALESYAKGLLPQ